MTSILARVSSLLLRLALCAAASTAWTQAGSEVTASGGNGAAPRSELAAWDAFAGEWLADADAARRVEQGVRAATASMNFLARPIARHRLQTLFPAPSGLRLHRDGDVFVIEFLGPKATVHALPISGAEVVEHHARLHLRLEDTTLHHTGTTGEGRRENQFRLEGGADRLAMATTITSSQLPQPVRYTLIFQRRPTDTPSPER